jgi:hypothetical protein
MAIRDTSYYGWHRIFEIGATSNLAGAIFTDFVFDQSGSFVFVGHYSTPHPDHYRSIFVQNKNDTVYLSSSYRVSSNKSLDFVSLFKNYCYAVGSSDDTGIRQTIFLKSSDYGKNWTIIEKYTTDSAFAYFPCSMCVSSSGDVFYTSILTNPGAQPSDIRKKPYDSDVISTTSTINSVQFTSMNISPSDGCIFGSTNCATGSAPWSWEVFKSSDHGTTFSKVDTFTSSSYYALPMTVLVDNDENIFVAGALFNTGQPSVQFIRKSTNKGTNWTTILSRSDGVIYDMACDSKNVIYAVGEEDSVAMFKYSIDGGTNWVTKKFDTLNAGGTYYHCEMIKIDKSEDKIYIFFQDGPVANGWLSAGKLTANSASLGPTMLCPSFGYVLSESSGVVDERFNLNNLSEFPHSSGLFQMKNMVLGTQDSGQIGSSDDSIIQVNHIGSVVKVMWPQQKSQNQLVKGYGDFSIGERVGKLNTQFQPGDTFNVSTEGYDHLALYCYLLKQSSGTLDNVEIKVERRPLGDKGFAPDQSIEYQTSGSVTVAKLRDVVYQKEIDYGDLSIREIGYPIDIPLENVREVRISARHANGQPLEDNKNFIVWGRFIKSSKNTNEV